MSVLNIVLVEPEIPQNTGNIARTCAVTGARLHLIEPLGFKIDDKKLKHAGLDYWQYLDITIYKDLNDFFEKNKGGFFFFSTKAKNVYSDIEYPDNAFLFFGKDFPCAFLSCETLSDHRNRQTMDFKLSHDVVFTCAKRDEPPSRRSRLHSFAINILFHH